MDGILGGRLVAQFEHGARDGQVAERRPVDSPRPFELRGTSREERDQVRLVLRRRWRRRDRRRASAARPAPRPAGSQIGPSWPPAGGGGGGPAAGRPPPATTRATGLGFGKLKNFSHAASIDARSFVANVAT